MLKSPHHPQDDHDHHLRSLIDQRSARAAVHGRFSAISEYSDTPSVYSRAYFSPKPSDNGDHQNYRGDYDYASPISPSDPRSGHDPQPTSMLDFDDDPRSSFAIAEGYDNERTTYEDGEDDADPNLTARMSYLGPKMRFHSRAPWEMDGGAVEEVEEPEDSPHHFPTGFPFSRGNKARSGTSGSSSPRPSYNSRPSMESARSQVPPKRSFETINSQMSYPRGALYALAQESMSTNSLGRSAAPPQKETLRGKFSLGPLRSETSTLSGPSSTSIPSPVHKPIIGRFPPSPRAIEQTASHFEAPTRSAMNAPYVRKSHSAPVEENIHPYANPDLVVSYAKDQPPQHSASNYSTPPRNDSSVTVTESFSTDSVMRSTIRSTSTLTPDSSMNSVSSKHRTSTITARDISSPVSVIGPSQRIERLSSDNRQDQTANLLPPGVTNISGWTERNAAPAFSLISLEEARAQRMRSSTASGTSRISSTSGSTDILTPFPVGESDSSNTASVSESSLPFTTRARGRSISAGAKARNALQTIVGQPKPERRDSEPPIVAQQGSNGAPAGKTLKHKKSGFMRLFNAGKAPEKDDRESPPPVPSLPDNANQYQHAQKTPKSSVQRIPAPSVSASSFEPASVENGDSLLSESDSWKPNVLSPRRIPPALSINIHGSPTRVSTSVVTDRQQPGRTLGALERPWMNDQQPQSAPAIVSEFPALKLRPVSTLFSAHFGDHIVTTESRSSDETTDLDTPRSLSPNGLMSPFTPGSFTRSSNDQPQVTAVRDDQSSVVKALQEQIISAKTAWQRQIWELEGQVQDLKSELKGLKSQNNDEYCQSCGRGKKEAHISAPAGGSVVNRPRVRTGTSSRFGNALP